MTKGRGAAAARAEHQGCGQAAPPRLVSRPLRFVNRPLRFVSRCRRLWGVGGPLGAVQRAPQWASLQGRRFGAQDSASTTHGPGRRLGALPRLVLALSWAFRSVRRRVRLAPPAGRARAQHGARSGARYGAQPLAHGGESASDGGGGLRGQSEVIRGHRRSSVCIKAHQRVHQRSSEAIRGHQRPSEAYLHHADVVCAYQQRTWQWRRLC